MTSGFNIGENVSLDPRFNELLGFTEAEVREVLERYRGLGVFRQDVDEALGIMREWYDGYRFSEDADTTLYNTGMVLYYLKQSVQLGTMPRHLIDQNVRIDYTKLRHLLVVGRQLNGNFDLLRHVAGEERAEVELQPSFPLERLAERDNFLSLLYYFGLLSIREVLGGATVLGIPNRTVRQLLYGFLRDAYRDMGLFSLDAHRLLPLLRRMATDGDWAPVFELIAERIETYTGIRDYIAGEKVLQGFLAAYLSMGEQLVLHSDRGRGHREARMPRELESRVPEGCLVETVRFGRREGAARSRTGVWSLSGTLSTQAWTFCGRSDAIGRPCDRISDRAEEIEELGGLFEDLDAEPRGRRLPLQPFAREPHDGSSHTWLMTESGTTRFHPATSRPLPAPRFSK